jgi:hypothetical protein
MTRDLHNHQLEASAYKGKEASHSCHARVCAIKRRVTIKQNTSVDGGVGDQASALLLGDAQIDGARDVRDGGVRAHQQRRTLCLGEMRSAPRPLRRDLVQVLHLLHQAHRPLGFLRLVQALALAERAQSAFQCGLRLAAVALGHARRLDRGHLLAKLSNHIQILSCN